MQPLIFHVTHSGRMLVRIGGAPHVLNRRERPNHYFPPRKGLQTSLTNFFFAFHVGLSRNLVKFLTIWSPSLQTPNMLVTMFCHCCSEGTSRQRCQIMKYWRHFVWHLYYSATSSIDRSSAAIGFERTLRKQRLYGKRLYEKHERKTAMQ